MRLYFAPEVTAGEFTSPDLGGLSVNGAFTHLRNGYLCTLGDDAPHADLISVPGVTFLPFVNGSGNPLGLDATVGSIPAGRRSALQTALENRGVPLDGIGLTDTIETVVKRIHRRVVVRQMIRDAGLADLGGLDTADDFTARLEALRARRIDVDGLTETRPRDLLARLLPRIRGVKVKPWVGPVRRSSFTDAFTRADENLEASANWTNVGGAGGEAGVRSNQLALLTTGTSLYQCPDQSSANHYTECTKLDTAATQPHFLCCVRASDAVNYIGWGYYSGATYFLYVDAGSSGSDSYTLLGSYAATVASGDVLRVEADGNSIEAFLNGVSRVGPVTETHNNTVTRQGINTRAHTANPAADDFEGGALAAGGMVFRHPANVNTLLRM